jgi:hypothetical protein
MNTITAMKDADIGIACIVTHSTTPGLPESYVVFDNGLTLPIVGWMDDSGEPTDDPKEYCYFAFGDDDIGYGQGEYDAYSMPSYGNH